MQTYVRMMAFGVFFIVVLLVLQGCARKQVGGGSESLTSDQSGEYQANGTQMEEADGKTIQMTPEEMEEYRLQEEKRRKKAEAEQDEKEELRQEAAEKLSQRIHFAFDSYELRSEARQTLKEKAEIMDANSKVDLVIEGHCDQRGTDEYNLALGERRARAAYEFLVLLGIDPDRMNIISYGEERPLDPEDNEQAWAKNRRCEFRVAQE
ncbi:MAG: peptidoglycan-associated lipoprotein Pal [Desulfovermiculus sp.]